jgi:hypothetical protein
LLSVTNCSEYPGWCGQADMKNRVECSQSPQTPGII